jgi:hypothetical protein
MAGVYHERMDAPPLSRRAFLNLVGAAPLAAATPAAAQTTSKGAGSFTDAGGLRVGHFTDRRRRLDCGPRFVNLLIA